MKMARVVLLCALPSFAAAQWMNAPPTYDYVPEVAGVQPPRSTAAGAALAGFEQRVMRSYQIGLTLTVSLEDLQAALPPGFTAQASGPGVAALGAAFMLGQGNWHASFGTSAPYSYAVFYATATNTNVTPARAETVMLAIEAGSAVAVAQSISAYGAGASRLAEVEEEIESDDGSTRFRVKVKDDGIGLSLRAEARCEGAIANRFTQDPDPRIWRFTDGRTAGLAFRQAYQGDFKTTSVDQARALVSAKDGYLGFPGGAVRVLGLTGTVSFGRNVESFRRLFPD